MCGALAAEILELWEEFEARSTPEAKLAKSIDKLEVLLQHNNTDISTWDDGDYGLNPYDSEERFNFDKFIRAMKNRVNADVMEKIEQNKAMDKVKEEHKNMWKKQKSIIEKNS